jgi:hypothetical protein
VLDMKREVIKIVLVNPAVLATVLGTPPNVGSSPGIDHQSLKRSISDELASNRRALDLSSVMNVPKET